MNEAERRIRDLELRGVMLEQGSNQAEASLNPTTPSLPRQDFYLTATGCNGLALAIEPLSFGLLWVNVTDRSTGNSYGGNTADVSLAQSLVTDLSGYASWSSVYPQWMDPATGTLLTIGNYYFLSRSSGGSFYYDPSGSYEGNLVYYVGTMYTSSSNYSGHGYNGGSPYYTLVSGANSWFYYGQYNNATCWPGLARSVSAHTLTVTGGGGGTLSSGGSLTATRSGISWNWTGSTWSGTTTGTYHVFWSLNYTTKVLSASVYHYSVFGGDAPVTTTSEGQSGVLYATSTATPTITSSPFSAAYNFSGTTVGTLTGIGTVTLTEP